MPNYQFKDKNTGDISEQFMSISDKEKFLKQNPHILQVLGSTSTISGVNTRSKVPDGFNDVLKGIQKASGKSNNIRTK